MKNYDAIVRNAYSKVTSGAGDRDESLFFDAVSIFSDKSVFRRIHVNLAELLRACKGFDPVIKNI